MAANLAHRQAPPQQGSVMAGAGVRALVVLLALFMATAAAADDGPWSGTWETYWQGGATYLEFTQTGNKVQGRIPLLGQQIDGEANGRTLTGTWTDESRTGSLTFHLAPDRLSFLGRFDNGDWWTGNRVTRRVALSKLDQSTPRAVLRSFFLAGNRWRAGAPDEIGRVAATLDFGDESDRLTRLQRLERAQALYDLADLTTLQLWTVPENPPTPELFVPLPQAGTDATLPLHLHRDDAGKWWIVMPGAKALAEHRKALLARFDGHMPSRNAFLQQRSARDTMHSFLDAFHDWDGTGRAQALAALDLSALPEATREQEGALAAIYLKHILDRVSLIITEEIPDDPGDRNPYVHFMHPAGRVAIAPIGNDQSATWKFTTDTVATVRDIYADIGSMPVVGGGIIRVPETPFFAARHFFVVNAPWMLHRFDQLEYWQALGVGGVLLIGFLVACLVAWPLLLLCGALLAARGQAIRPLIAWPLRIALTALIWQLAMPVLGLPHGVRRFTDPGAAVILALAATWIGWYLVDAIGHRLSGHDESRPGSFDDVSVSLAVGGLRIAVVVGGFLYAADSLSIPYAGIIAGLGISGLAVAFASKETLSNVFGAGILMIDRPFRRGDSIVAGDTRGVVEHVGIRSTRIRTPEDSIIIVPNGKLSDATINNLGTRRHRLVKATLVLPYSVPSTKVAAFKSALEDMLVEHEKVVSERASVGVKTLTSAGFELELTFYLDVASATDENETRHALMLAISTLAERMHVTLGEAVAATAVEPVA
jgi:MscS family membrane protein